MKQVKIIPEKESLPLNGKTQNTGSHHWLQGMGLGRVASEGETDKQRRGGILGEVNSEGKKKWEKN